MTRAELIAFRLQPALKECSLHQARLHAAWQEAASFEPLRDGSLAEFSEDQVRTLDQLLFRFGRLQDAIGTRLLPATLQFLQEWRDNEPFLDKLNRAEKLGLLPSAEQWQLLRELRNQTAHENPDQPELVRANLRRLIASVPDLESAHKQLSACAQSYIVAAR